MLITVCLDRNRSCRTRGTKSRKGELSLLANYLVPIIKELFLESNSQTKAKKCTKQGTIKG